MNETFKKLKRRIGEVADVEASLALSQWDQETYMPPKASEGRGRQQATLSAISHRMFTDQEMGKLLYTLRDSGDKLTADEMKLVDETIYDYERATKLPESFVETFAEERSRAFDAWVSARDMCDFSLFQPMLQTLVELLKKKADYYGYEGSPYNALLEDYERGMTAEKIKPVFANLAEKQSALVDRIVAAEGPDTSWLKQNWDEQGQWDFSLKVLKDLGFDLQAGRQDKSVHPFTTNFDIYDVRITTRISEQDLFSGLMSTIHECGHGLYEQGFLPEDRRTALGNAISLGIHESQSRMWENVIGRSLPFWNYYIDEIKKHFPTQLESISAEQIFAAINKVEPSLIRVEADECTYNLHIILRFEIETALMEGTLDVKDIPEIWNAKVKEYLGLDVPNDAMGCLQDIHWSHGLIGYFPTYALGNLYSAQMFETIVHDIPDLWTQVSSGKFDALLGWLRSNVHAYGRRKTAPTLIKDISGKELESKPYLDYLENKYSKIYAL